MTDEPTHIATAAASLADPYAALSQHLHGDGDEDVDMSPPTKLWLAGANVFTTAPEHEWEAQPYTRDDLADPAWRTRAMAAEAELGRLRVENDDLKSSVIAFCGPWAVKYARDFGLPDGHLMPTHYDILERAGARMDYFTRASLAGGDPDDR